MTASEVRRDRHGRPLIIPPEGGKPVPYARASSFAKCLEDDYHLIKWQQRQVAIGITRSEHLRLLVEAHEHDKREMDSIVEEAKKLAGSSTASERGTALHTFTERLDRGAPLDKVSIPWVRKDLDAYAKALAPYERVGIEQFVVCDEFQVAGTFDRLLRHAASPSAPAFIADIKTSKPSSINYGLGKFAVQLALYAHGSYYDPSTGERTPLPALDVDNGLIIHLPAELGYCDLKWIDLAAGWQHVTASRTVAELQKAFRSRRDWSVADPYAA